MVSDIEARDLSDRELPLVAGGGPDNSLQTATSTSGGHGQPGGENCVKCHDANDPHDFFYLKD